ncbi:MAG TPA: GH116 family glycosyl hydrolase [Verrucomicrobiota bacterium]|nr:GH116 family glycosyl hydrolase [Verrucomicrobiota bacterium]HNU51337.1 GH116 family glycosyl hydrolase [Verrucomicrobiota bacterium]
MPESNRKRLPRRDFLKLTAASAGAWTALQGNAGTSHASHPKDATASHPPRSRGSAKFNTEYAGPRLNRVAFPMGGMGAGMLCLEGTGALSHVSLRHRPEVFNEPMMFAALCVKGTTPVARVIEGPVPAWKLFGMPGSGNGAAGTAFGLPRFRTASFHTHFPFATVSVRDPQIPLQIRITGWSPFAPGDTDDSSLPVAALEYAFVNRTRHPVEAVFSFNARNFMATSGGAQAVKATPEGFVLWNAAAKDKSWEEGAFAVTVSDPALHVNHAWFRGGWWDALTMAWKDIAEGACYDRPPVASGNPSPGATLFVPFRLEPGQSKTIAVRFAWFVGQTNLRIGKDPSTPSPVEGTYKPWYAGRFTDVNAVIAHWRDRYQELRDRAQRFSRCFYDSTLPPEVLEAVAANLTILKSPTVLRQADGRLWCWEGCSDNAGCCHGSCTHVWNYAQAIAHLFPTLERSLRETEFGPSQDDRGHQTFRASLPIRPAPHDFHAAADGQLGGILKVHREWRISGDTEWLRRLWPRVRQSLDFCIETWDPTHQGWLAEPHHNTYDIEFWGPDGMCTSFYLGALSAAVAMGKALGDDTAAYAELLAKGRQRTESELYDGEYFIQKIEWQSLRAKNPVEVQSFGGDYSPEARALLEKEGPKYQYGRGCLADGVLGAWMALVCGVGDVLDPGKIRSHLRAVHRHNLKTDLTAHANPQRPSYACGAEGGLLICTWPKGGALSLPFVYSNEVWTGIEYQVASHLIFMGRIDEGLEIVRVCRSRYDGRVRNPFNEYECGHWYARALSSYALLQALTGARYDAIEKTLYLKPALRGDFRCFLATATGYGTVGVRRGKPFFDLVSGTVEIRRIDYRA